MPLIKCVLSVFVFFLLIAQTRAELPLSQIKASGQAYKLEIESKSLPNGDNTEQLLRDVRKAQTNANSAEVVRLYEEFAKANKNAFEAWLNLSLAWRDLDPAADKGLAAASLAYELSPSSPQQIEALLLMSSFLRAQLGRGHSVYVSRKEDSRKVDARLVELNEAGSSGDTQSLDDKDPQATIAQLKRTQASAIADAEAAFTQVENAASALDQLYREIATKVPGLSVDKMRSMDDRFTVFAPLQRAGTDQPMVEFRPDNQEVKACISFNQDLLASGSYSDAVEVQVQRTKLPVSIEAKGREICLSRMTAGEEHTIILKPSLASKQGAKLGKRFTVAGVRVPDLPESVGFSGRQFILPDTGPGEVVISSTNAELFELELFRITDRTLHRHIALGHVGGELPFNEYNDLRNHFAEQLWKGEVRLGNVSDQKNKSIKVSLPVRELLGKRLEWIQNEIINSSNDIPEVTSSRRSFSIRAEGNFKAQLDGVFLAGRSKFESVSPKILSPGVYALTAQDRGASLSKRIASCQDDCADHVVQWFIISDTGLTFYEGDENFYVLARSLGSGRAKQNAKIELVASNNRVLGVAKTNENGVAPFARSLTVGTQSNALVAIMAYNEEDFSFLPFNAERLELSRLNVDGRPLSQGLRAFLTTDRGIYQPGETVEIAAIVRNNLGQAPDAVPAMTVRLEARDRASAPSRIAPQSWLLGGTKTSLTIPQNAREGTARISLSPDGGAGVSIGEATIQIGEVRPDRVRLDFLDKETGWKVVRTSANFLTVSGKVSGQYLFANQQTSQGAAKNLKAEVTVKVAAAETPVIGCYQDFAFGALDSEIATVAARQSSSYTDDNGILQVNLQDIAIANAPRPLAVTIEVTLFDASGPLGSRSQTFPVADQISWIGLRKIPALQPGKEGGKTRLGIDIVRVNSAAALSETQLDFTVEGELDSYVWERSQESWYAKRNVNRKIIAKRSVNSRDLKTADAARGYDGACLAPLRVSDLADSLDAGRYLLTVRDVQTGRETSIQFHTGAVTTEAARLEPSIFALSTDKQSYQPGDNIVFTGDVRFDGEVIIAIADGDIREWVPGRVNGGKLSATFKVPTGWAGKGLYALATVFQSGATGTKGTGPSRVLGSAYFSVSGTQAGYQAAVGLKNSLGTILPNEKLSFRVCMAELSKECFEQPTAAKAYPEAYAIAFVVDEGLLSLTAHHSPVPDPKNFFYGRGRLAVRVMDNYGRLLLQEGGDRPTRLALSNYTSEKILSLSLGPKQLIDGRADFDIPALELQNGTAEIFVLVWSKDYATATRTSVSVRNSVVADISSPSFVYSGDKAIVPLRLQNIDFTHQGEYRVRVKGAGKINGVAVVGDELALPNAFLPSIEFRDVLKRGDAPKTKYLALDFPMDSSGPASIEVDVEAIGSPVGLRGYPRSWSFDVRIPALSSLETADVVIGPQSGSLNKIVEGIVAGNYDPDTTRIRLQFASSPTELLLGSVDERPNRSRPTLEDLISRGALLLANTDKSNPDVRRTVQSIVSEIMSLQLPEGSFVPYRTLGDPTPSERNVSFSADGSPTKAGLLRTAIVLEFLWRSKVAGYDVPESSFQAARRFVETHPDGVTDVDAPCTFDMLYAALVLTEIGRHDSAKITQIERCKTETAAETAARAAVLTKFGRGDQASVILASIQDQLGADALDLGQLRLAMMMNLLAESRAPLAVLDEVAKALIRGSGGTALSQSAQAWLKRTAATQPQTVSPRLRAEDIRLAGMPIVLKSARSGGLMSETFLYRELKSNPTTVASSQQGVRGLVTVEGVLTNQGRAKRIPSGALQRRFFDYRTGREVRPGVDTLKIGDRLVVTIEGTKDLVRQALNSDVPNEGELLLVSDLLPSAFRVVPDLLPSRNEISLAGVWKKTEAVGDLRLVESSLDRWVGLIVPQSSRNSGEANQPGADDVSGVQKFRPSGEGSIDFRLSYVVRVNMAGRFTLPGVSIESGASSAKTFRTEASLVEVKGSDAAQR